METDHPGKEGSLSPHQRYGCSVLSDDGGVEFFGSRSVSQDLDPHPAENRQSVPEGHQM